MTIKTLTLLHQNTVTKKGLEPLTKNWTDPQSVPPHGQLVSGWVSSNHRLLASKASTLPTALHPDIAVPVRFERTHSL